MTSRRQYEPATPAYPRATRWLAALCLLLFGWVGTAQAVHVHGDWLPHHAAQLQTPATDASTLGGEERCPLCVAAHPALPVSFVILPLPATPVHRVVCRAEERAGAAPWHPCSLSRPPPAIA